MAREGVSLVVALLLLLFLAWWMTPAAQTTSTIGPSVPLSTQAASPVTITRTRGPQESLNTPFGVLDRDPVQNTRAIFKIGDVVALYNHASNRYLNMVPALKAKTGTSVTIEYDFVIECSSDNAMRPDSQWLVLSGVDTPTLPGSIRLQNVGNPNLFLKGFSYQNSLNPAFPHAGWQPGLGETQRSNLYSTMFNFVDPTELDSSSVVIYSALLGQQFPYISRDEPIFLTANADGTIADPSNTSSDAQLQWDVHVVGKRVGLSEIQYVKK